MSASIDNKLFTFLAEKEGSTFVEQFPGRDLAEALSSWFSNSRVHPGRPLEGDRPTPVASVAKVWCTGGHDPQGVFYLVHIIETTRE